jgi:predicted enzyme related to lactoylglutathione lyase
MGKHAIVHVEIPSTDPKTSGKFYADLFGWDIQADNDFEYVMFNPGEGPGGGFTNIDGENTKPGDVLMYVSTTDLESSLAKAESLGGKRVMGETEVPGMGWFAIFVDPSGNRIALWKSARED